MKTLILTIIIMGTLTHGNVMSQNGVESVQLIEVVQKPGPFDNSVVLEWRTASEMKNEGFVVERKKNPESDFEFAGYVDGNGSTSEASKYTFIEMLPCKSVKYRIKQISYSGESRYYYPVGLPITEK